MKTKHSIALILIITICSLVGLAWIPSGQPNPEPTIVLLKFKTQPDKGAEAVSALKVLFEEVKKEPHFISITLHVDPNDPTQILLYEQWEDANYYNNEHMNTAHLKAFMAESRHFLAGPPDISFWNVQHVVQN